MSSSREKSAVTGMEQGQWPLHGNTVSVQCWCGHADLIPFGPDYASCTACGSLVLRRKFSGDDLLVVDDEQDFYGKKYWLEHQATDFEYPDIFTRTRTDLTERNLFWLKTLLKYLLPPARVVELGCAHGSFVALMQQAGYQASGVEMSPWVVEFGRKTFGIDVQAGPVEMLDVAPGSLDAIAMMDVMEHLPDPVATMAHCLDLLKPDGILLVQMPEFQEGMRFDSLVETASPFLDQLKVEEHLFLYSKRATTEFFHRLGAEHIRFEPAIFAHYDMFFVVSRSPLQVYDQQQIDLALSNPNSRMVLALLDLKDELTEKTASLVSERNSALSGLADMRQHFDDVEADRIARGSVIESQGTTIANLQAQVHERLNELRAVYPQLEELRHTAATQNEKLRALYVEADELSNERNYATAQLADLRANFDLLSPQLDELRRTSAAQNDTLRELYERADRISNERNYAIAELADLRSNFEAVNADRGARLAVIESQGRTIADLQSQLHERLNELGVLYPQFNESQQISATQASEMLVLQRLLEANEREVIEARREIIKRDELLELERARVAQLDATLAKSVAEAKTLESAVASLRTEVERLGESLAKAVIEARTTQDLLTQRELDVAARDAQMETLARRWWWRMGKFIKAL